MRYIRFVNHAILGLVKLLLPVSIRFNTSKNCGGIRDAVGSAMWCDFRSGVTFEVVRRKQ